MSEFRLYHTTEYARILADGLPIADVLFSYSPHPDSQFVAVQRLTDALQNATKAPDLYSRLETLETELERAGKALCETERELNNERESCKRAWIANKALRIENEELANALADRAAALRSLKGRNGAKTT